MCERIELPGGGFAFICGTRRRPALCGFCKKTPHSKLCDAEVGQGKTCDAKICDGCAKSIGPDRDLCPRHVEELETMQFPAKREDLQRAGYTYSHSRECRLCERFLEFWRTPKGSLAPLEVVIVGGAWLMASHFATCPYASKFRKQTEIPADPQPRQESLFQ